MNTNRNADRVDDKAKKAIERVLMERLGKFGYQDARIYPGFDHDGDPVLFIEARYRLSETPIDPGITFGLIGSIREALEAIGETRFPHVRHHFDVRQQVSTSS
ncbi:MAG: hypothetical protein HY246_21070 [Proteobacteria bacterium]|nr:hypothetical protein [Pseudomonadota bacterium]